MTVKKVNTEGEKMSSKVDHKSTFWGEIISGKK